MALNKKQQKQIEAAKNKITRLRGLLTAAKNQPDLNFYEWEEVLMLYLAVMYLLKCC